MNYEVIARNPSRALRRRRARELYEERKTLRFALNVVSRIRTLKRNQG